MSPIDIHAKYMKQALLLARKGAGRVSPNPMVGAVVVRDGGVVGSGFHRVFGGPHAEVEALKDAGERALGADLYVTLEPCCHYGKTPPCTEAVIGSGIRRVFVGMIDPHPSVSGEGIKKIQQAGIDVTTGILEKDCRTVNESFIKFTTARLPFVTLKTALSMDGKTATYCRDSKWISGKRSRKTVHRLRSHSDAVMVGIETVMADDPLLTVRLDGCKTRQPLRIVVDSRLRIPLESRMLGDNVVIATVEGNSKTEKAGKLIARGVELIETPAKQNRVDLRALMQRLADRDIASILLEGGSELNSSALEAGLVDKVIIFYAPKIIGGAKAPGMVGGEGIKSVADAIGIERITLRRVDDDIMVQGYIARRSSPSVDL